MRPKFGRVPTTGDPEMNAFLRRVKQRAESKEPQTDSALQAGTGSVTRVEIEALKAFLRDFL